MMSDTAFDEIVSSFYSAASGNQSWESALLHMKRELSAFLIYLHAVDTAKGKVAFFYESSGLPPEGTLDYLRTYHRIDPRVKLLLGLRPGEWINCWEHFDDTFVAADPFYQEFLIPYGGRYASGTLLLEEGFVSVILGVHRGLGSPKLNVEEISVCRRLASHLTQALRQHHVYLYRHKTVGLGAALLDRLHTPIALLDSERRILHANAAAANIIASGAILFEMAGRLYCRQQRSDKTLVAALYAMHLTPPSEPNPVLTTTAFVRVSSPMSNRDAGLFLSAWRPEETLDAFGDQPVAMLMIHEPGKRLVLDTYAVGKCFGLSPAEAKIAVAIAGGYSPEYIAKKHAVELSTVRTQLKAVYSKTGASRQAELVSVLACLPIRTLEDKVPNPFTLAD